MASVCQYLFLALLIVAATASSIKNKGQRKIGGSETTITEFPFAAAVLYRTGNVYIQGCGGTILNGRSVLSAASCFPLETATNYRLRLGSSWPNAGGVVYEVLNIGSHESFNLPTLLNNDIAIVRTRDIITFNNVVLPVTLPHTGYVFLPDDEPIVAIGWGFTSTNAHAEPSDHLRKVELRSINQAECRARYPTVPFITSTMFCAGHPDGGRDTCFQDTGSPQLHHEVIVGVTSLPLRICGSPYQPSISTRVVDYLAWILENA